MEKIVIVYGTFDMYQQNHRKTIKKSKKEGYKLYVGLSSDEYLKMKGEIPLLSYEERKQLIETDTLVDFIFPNETIDQLPNDIKKYNPKTISISIEHKKQIENNELLNDFNISYFQKKSDFSTTKIKFSLNNNNVVITYGTFDFFHHGHEKLLKRAKLESDILICAISTDEFNFSKGKKAHNNFSERVNKLYESKIVDYIISENYWEQKELDFIRFNVNKLVMGSDWVYKFDKINKNVKVKILKRTEGISSTQLRKELKD